MANLTYSSELMHNYLHAGVVAPQSKFEALQTPDGHSLLFAVGTDGVLSLVQEHSGLSTAGWLRTDLSTAQISKDFPQPGATCRTFAADQSVQDQTLSLALVVGTSTGDNLYLSLGNSSTDTGWAAAPQWGAYPFDSAELKLPKLVIVNTFFCEVSEGKQYIIVDVLRDPNSTVQDIFRFYIDPTSTTGHFWQGHDVAVDIEVGTYSSSLGRFPGAPVDGLYTAGSAGSSGQLVYAPVVNVFGGGPPEPVRLDLPASVLPKAIATARNADVSTDLFVIGYTPPTDPSGSGHTSLYYFGRDQQASNKVALLFAHPLLSDTTQLYAFKTKSQAYLWALNRANQVFYTTCSLDQLATGDAWSVPMPISTGVTAISPYVNLKNEGNTFFAVSENSLHKMMKSPATGLWSAQGITLPAPTPTTKAQSFSAYTTRIQLLDEANQPMVGAPLLVSAIARGGFFINNLYYVLDPTPISIPTDATGSITIIESVQKLHGTQLTVTGPDGTPVSINPMDKAFKKIAALNSVDSLQSAVITSPNGSSTRPLVSPSVSGDNLKLLAQSNQDLATAYHSLPPTSPFRRPPGGAAALAGSPNSVFSDIGDLFRWLESGIEALVQIAQEAGSTAWHFIVTVADGVYRAVLDTVEAVISAAEWVFNAIKTAIADLLKFLEFLFDWADITRTKAVIHNLSKIFLADRISGIATIKTELGGLMTSAETILNTWAGGTDWTALGPAATVPSNASSTPANPKAASAPSSLLAYHAQHNLVNATSPAAARAVAYAAPAPGSPADVLRQALAQEEQVLSQVGTQIMDLVEQFTTLSLADLLKQLVAILADAVLSSTQVVLDALLDILAEMATEVLALLDTPLYIPVLSDILSDFGVPPLSVLDAFSWITAVAATLGYKLLEGVAPYPAGPMTTLLSTATDFQTVVKAFNPATGPQNGLTAQAGTPTPDQQDQFKAGHLVGGMGSVLTGLIGIPEALSPPDENPTASRSAAVFGVLSGMAVAWPNYFVPVLPIKDPVINPLATMMGILSVASPLVIFAAGQAGALEDPRTTSAEANVVLMVPKMLCTCWHLSELAEVADGNDKTQAILEEVSNLTRYLSAVAYLTAVESVPDTLAAGLYGATIVCAGGLQIAESEISMV